MQSLSEELAEQERIAPLLASIKEKDVLIAELERENINLRVVIERHIHREKSIVALLGKDLSSPALPEIDVIAEVNEMMEGI